MCVLCEIDLFVYTIFGPVPIFLKFSMEKSNLIHLLYSNLKQFHTVETVPKSNRQMIERGKAFLSR